MQTILISTDFSENAKNATDYGIALFDDKRIEFILLHTFYIPYASPGIDAYMNDATENNVKEQFGKELYRIHTAFPNLKATIKTSYKVGDIVSVVGSIEKKKKIYAVVMGTKGASGLSEILVGSRTASMVKSVDSPVFVIPEKAKFTALKKILFTTDLDLHPTTNELSIMIDLAKKFQSEINILHVKQNGMKETVHNSFIKHELANNFISMPSTFDSTIGENISKTIESYLKENPTDLVVMVNVRGNFFHKIFHKSITKKIAIHTTTPMLVTHHKL
jgi:nucleotide-binding universal stress UspA family protein